MALDQAAHFARTHGLMPWDSLFSQARSLDTAAAHDPGAVHHQDLLPADQDDVTRRQLAAKAQRAWMFGGMGSWNDLRFSDAAAQTQYEQVSSELFSAFTFACMAAANAT